MMAKAVPERAEIVFYGKRLGERQAAKRAMAKDAELAAALAG